MSLLFNLYKIFIKGRLIKRRIRSFFYLSLLNNSCKDVRFGKIVEIKGFSHIIIGKKCYFGDFLYLTAWDNYSCHDCNGKLMNMKHSPTIKVGDGCHFGAFNNISCINRIEIGNNVLTGKWVTIIDNSHGDSTALDIPPFYRQLQSKGPVFIKDNVWIGDKVTILAGVTIGEGAIIAANSVVTKDVMPFTVVGGIPAKQLKSNINKEVN